MRGPSDELGEVSKLSDGSIFHDLGKMYPDAPIPEEGGQILRNAVIDGSDGLPALMDWVSQGDMVIVDVSPIIDHPERLSEVIDPLMVFVEQQMGGQLLNFGHSRLLLLPSTHQARGTGGP
ncbi:MAG: hypothetical protein ACPGN8_02360 [Candidatus Thalassarchaeaceae archaeon]|jgi:SepF-like predicted cell division protein (DUF552 family)|tara:strand:- start:719 stop:1081 length:363 start_codon:yes stop_codon:yes gene_type:complete